MSPETVFQIESSRGKDELGEVFFATHRETGKQVGLKLFDNWTVAQSDSRIAWRQALEKLHDIGPARTPRVEGAHIEAENSWLATQWVEGPTLAQVLSKAGRLDENTAAVVGCGILDALSELHENEMVHGGVIPNKVILTKGYDASGVVITDPFQHFLYSVKDPVNTSEDRFIGLPKYYSPEQAQGKTPDIRSEIYVVGLILYEMATGVTPFASKSRAVTLRRQMNEPAMAALIEDPDVNVSQDYQDIINLALNKDPEQRIQNPKEMREMLNACRQHPDDISLARLSEPLRVGRGKEINTSLF